MRRFAVLLACSLTACDDTEENRIKAAEAVEEGQRQLAGGQLGAARAQFDDAVALDPSRGDAPLGSAIVDVLTLPDAQPVRDLLARCGQPALDLETKLFGPQGILARDAAFRAGTSTLTILTRSGSTSAWSDTGFRPTSIRAFIDDGELQIKAREEGVREDTGVYYAWISMNAADLRRGDSGVTSLGSGAVIPAAELAGGIDVFDRDHCYGGEAVGGTITIVRGGSAVGSPLEIRFDDVRLVNRYCSGSYPNYVAQEWQLSGTIVDTVDAIPSIDRMSFPFAGLDDDPGPPHRSQEVVALEKCPGLSWDDLAAAGKALAARLEGTSAKLGSALSHGDAAGFVLPKTLFHTAADIPLNEVDARMLKALVDGAAAFLRLVTQFRHLDVAYATLLREYQVWYVSSSGPMQRLVRDFAPAFMVDALNRSFLARMPGFDLEPARGRLDSALREFAAAMRTRPTKPGVLIFQVPEAQPLAERLATLADAARTSLTSAAPVPIPGNPGYFLHLKAFLDSPLDRERLLANAGISALFELVRGDPSATDAYSRNDSIDDREPSGNAELNRWLGGVFSAPTAAGAPKLVLVDEDTLDRAMGTSPHFLSADVEAAAVPALSGAALSIGASLRGR